ncbi:MAG: hypothetical protein HOK52_01170 [Candidatus Marinimicrobia bacterium]|jgi:hypothetical protein|nr:hypothetical protein [Candidatus Neomarinimicrobiota bacterium]MBT3937059.1 hypothetical protein [Candidatus Neomarinimicrobiota bacterium]MBT3962029.1 hypothetical protein [Candidatus Neomarinimicrobiota bacterium]MBT4382397.1 hypothetical protein [Candidatus Neomarinimicrobiota bacterium]MBT4636514.1 hypothetical protein [Candidatus Neomarinimicrobiota bacterium]|tara:strand:+ start:45 stop:605 length:561 start_codon:yes stop_codon:yes gene_type:complete
MTKTLQYSLGILAVLAVLFLVNQKSQTKFEISSDRIYTGDADAISKIIIKEKDQSITLVKSDSTWSISDVDTLIMKNHQINNFFDKVVTLEKEILISKNPEKWNIFNVGDSTGKWFTLMDENDISLGEFVIGQGKDYSRNFIRIGDKPEVYRTNVNVQYLLNTNATFWGEVPPKPAVADTLSPVTL